MKIEKANTVLFDVGGVLTPDVIQATLFTPKKGLVDRLKLDWGKSFKAMTPAYEKFYLVPKSSEDDFWREIGKEIGVELPLDIVYEIEEEVVVPNPDAKKALDMIKNLGLRIGILSNNTDFWYSKVVKMFDLNRYVDPKLVFVSYQQGVLKPVGLFKKALEVVEPNKTVYLDDRSDYIWVAQNLGFHAMLYSVNDETSDLISILKHELGL